MGKQGFDHYNEGEGIRRTGGQRRAGKVSGKLPRSEVMDQLRRQVRRAQWLLGVQRFVGAAGWCLFATLLAALSVIVVDRFWPLGIEPWAWGAGAVGGGLLAAVVWAAVRGRGPTDAAIEIDRRFGLKERVASSLGLSEEERATDAGRAVVEDAMRRVERIEVAAGFALRPGRQLLLPLVPAIASVLVVLLVQRAGENPADAKSQAGSEQQIETARKSLQVKLAERRDAARQEGLEEAQKLLLKLQSELDRKDGKLGSDPKQRVVQLNDLAKQLEKRSQELAGSEAVQRQFEQLGVKQGPGDRFFQALARGDFRKAQEELKGLQEKLASGKLGAQERKQLAEQIRQAEKDLQKLADAHREAMKELEQRIEQLRRAGKTDEAEQAQKQLSKLRAQLPQMAKLQNLAKQMGECAECMQAGNLKEAADRLETMAGELKGFADQVKELEMMRESLRQLEQTRNQMMCSACQGQGCEQCQAGLGMGVRMDEGEGNGDGKGIGMGKGKGRGPRPEGKGDGSFFDTRRGPRRGPGAERSWVASAGRTSAGTARPQYYPRRCRQRAGRPTRFPT